MKTKLFLRWGALVAVAAAMLGCEVTSEKIRTWKQTVKGAAKLRAAVRDQGQTLEIRVEAAEALCEINVVAPLAEDLKAIDPAERKQIIDGLVKRLVGAMEGSNPKATTGVQIRARDSLFALRGLADGPVRQTMDEKVVRWTFSDWQSRGSGEHSPDKMILEIGETAGPVLAELVGQGGVPLVTTATFVRQTGPQSARDAVATKLVALAQQEKPTGVQTLHALGKVGSPTAVKYLEEVATQGALDQRVMALRALALSPDPSAIPTAKAIAADASLKDDQALLRDEAFSVLEKIDDPRSLEALVGFLSDKEEKVRYRAAEAILEGFKVKGIAKLLDGLSPGYTYKREDLADYIEDFIQKLGPGALPPLREALASKSWVARLVAARVLGKIGSKEDVSALEKLGSDTTKLRGWDGGATVGSEAMTAAQALKQR